MEDALSRLEFSTKLFRAERLRQGVGRCHIGPLHRFLQRNHQ